MAEICGMVLDRLGPDSRKKFFEEVSSKLACPGRFELPASRSAVWRSIQLSYGHALAEREGFEPSVEEFPPHLLSRQAPSTTRPPLRIVPVEKLRASVLAYIF